MDLSTAELIFRLNGVHHLHQPVIGCLGHPMGPPSQIRDLAHMPSTTSWVITLDSYEHLKPSGISALMEERNKCVQTRLLTQRGRVHPMMNGEGCNLSLFPRVCRVHDFSGEWGRRAWGHRSLTFLAAEKCKMWQGESDVCHMCQSTWVAHGRFQGKTPIGHLAQW